MRIHYNPTFLICQHSQYLKRSLIREQVCTSFSALPISSQRKVVVPYSLLSQPHCPLLDSPSTSHTCPLCYPHPHSLICGVPSGSTCQGTIQRSFPKKKGQVLPSASAVSPPSHSLPLLPPASHSLPFLLASFRSLSLPPTPSHFDHWYLWCLSPPHTFHPLLNLLLFLFNHLGDFSCHKIIPLTLLLPLLNLF